MAMKVGRRRAISTLLRAAAVLSLGTACERVVAVAPTPWPSPSPQSVPSPLPSPTADVAFVEEPVDRYLGVAPRVLRAGQRETVSVSLFRGDRLANGNVQVALLKDGQRLAESSGRIRGRGSVSLEVPKLGEGDYRLRLSGRGFQSESPIRVEEGTLVFVETDKPIYKPGQTVHIRVLTLDPQLRPVGGPVTVEVSDAKGIKVFKKEVQTDDFGLLSTDLPLSSEPNLGVWKVGVRSDKRTAQVDVRVERYVLPKYEVKVELAREWVLAGDPIKGTVRAEYSYGKPVQGEVEIRATRYTGTWQEFANVTRDLDTQVSFDLPAAGYVAGVPGAKGMGNVSLEVTVREKSTGYEEKTTRLISVAAAPLVLSLIPESITFKPSLPLSLLAIAETPDKKPTDATVAIDIAYTSSDFKSSRETRQVAIKGGKAILTITPPTDAISLTLAARARNAFTSLVMQSGYSPSGSFIHVEQLNEGKLKIGEQARFHVSATRQAANFYFEVMGRGKVVFSDFSRTADLEFTVTPAMAPTARVLVYQILPTSEVAADYVPFSVAGDYPQRVQTRFGKEEAKPGEVVEVSVQTEGPARVGLAAVDRSVFILAENRLNLQEVFAELERLYQKPQVELHEARPLEKIVARGAQEVFRDAGVVVLSNQQVPAGKEYDVQAFARQELRAGMAKPAAAPAAAPTSAPAAAPKGQSEVAQDAAGLAEVQRVRQFFPETWLWTDLTTDASGRASTKVDVPDSITTWMLRAVALSKDKGLGVAEAQLRVIQPFFTQIDLPYAVIRGEQFPVKIALYNYQAVAEEFTVELERADWFDLQGQPARTVRVGANDLAGAEFTIRPHRLGTQKVKVTARSRTVADAIVKDLIVEPEGVAREVVENLILSAGSGQDLPMAVPPDVIAGSARAFVGLTGSYLTQAIEGLEGLLKMPFGCGEQNMILFAPNVFVARYLRETNQMKPEVMAKAETLMITGYQRELTYRRGDGSFSAFGNSDKEGSLWLTAFVLKTFAQAKDLIFVDDTVLSSGQGWIVKQQKADGSFDPVGFVHHQELLGGLQGKTALTAYLAVALREAGEDAASARAVRYLEGALGQSDDAYTLALGVYALKLAKSPRADAPFAKLMKLARESDGALSWGDEPEPLPRGLPAPQPDQPAAPVRAPMPPRPNQSAAVETTAYALLALIEHGDRLNASRAARWLVGQRNAYGGYGSTQDTVVGLQALTRFAAGAKADVEATVTLRSGSWQKEARISASNADVLQLVDVPIGGQVRVEAKGRGQVVLQSVRRFNLPDPEEKEVSAFQIDVDYDAGEIEVDDLITVEVSVRFTPPEPIQAGMVVLDVAVPTGFAPETASIERILAAQAKVKRYEVAGRKVIFYLEDLAPEEQIGFAFQARALYPVRAQAVVSQAYSYYRPEWKGEALGGALVVKAR